MDAFTPQQTIELVSRIGSKKATMRLDKLWWNSFMSGPLLGFGCAWLVSTNASPWYQLHAPGLIRTLSALIFPIGLVMIVLSGADLFTSNIMFTITAFLHRRISLFSLFKILIVSFFGNLAGILFFMAVITGYGGVFSETEGEAYVAASVRLAVQKAVLPAWWQILLRAVGANWCVCFAVFASVSARDVGGKVVAIWGPTAGFVGLALDHVVANMFFVPNGIWHGAPITVGQYIAKSMLPTLLGNIIGGGLFVGTAYWYLYLTGETALNLSFDEAPVAKAVKEVGGPTRSARHRSDGHGEWSGETTPRGESQGAMMGNASSEFGGQGKTVCGCGREYGDEIYARAHTHGDSVGGQRADEKV